MIDPKNPMNLPASIAEAFQREFENQEHTRAQLADEPYLRLARLVQALEELAAETRDFNERAAKGNRNG